MRWTPGFFGRRCAGAALALALAVVATPPPAPAQTDGSIVQDSALPPPGDGDDLRGLIGVRPPGAARTGPLLPNARTPGGPAPSSDGTDSAFAPLRVPVPLGRPGRVAREADTGQDATADDAQGPATIPAPQDAAELGTAEPDGGLQGTGDQASGDRGARDGDPGDRASGDGAPGDGNFGDGNTADQDTAALGDRPATGVTTLPPPEDNPLTDDRFRVAPFRTPEFQEPERQVTLGAAQSADQAQVRVLDMITGITETVEVAAGRPVRYQRLILTLMACARPEDRGGIGDVGLLSITDRRIDAGKPVFQGWMFAESPALSALDHPRYDVWLISCIARSPESSGGSAQNDPG
ncbi:MAG: DUF2155 domain-containing protein [Pseudomonadota bacterium]